MRNMILASISAAALLVCGAASAQVTGTLGGGYARITGNGGADVYGLNGSLATAVGSGWNFEATGSYDNANPGGLDLWTMGGNMFTDTGFGRIAVGAIHGGVGYGHATAYGAGADWFYSDDITLSLKGGGEYISGGNSGGYVGAQGMYYVNPNLALSASADYVGNAASAGGVSLGDINTQKVKAEWQVSDTLPLSVYGGYQHYEAGSTDTNVVFVGLKFYMDGSSTLVGHHRTGSLGYIGQSFFQLGSY